MPDKKIIDADAAYLEELKQKYAVVEKQKNTEEITVGS
jgi:hypothetical protein